MEMNSHDMKNCGDGSSSGSVRGLSPRSTNSLLHTHQQEFNSTQIQLSTQQQQQQHPHPSPNGSGMVAGASHRMPSPAASMRVPPLMTAVSPMSAPVAQVAPVPRGFDHTQSQSMSQVSKTEFLSELSIPSIGNFVSKLS